MSAIEGTGKRIRLVREEHGVMCIECGTLKPMSMSELARRIGVKQEAISAWEHGKNLPGAKNLRALSEVFDVSVDWLLGIE